MVDFGAILTKSDQSDRLERALGCVRVGVDAKDERENLIQILMECYFLCSCFARKQPLESWTLHDMICRNSNDGWAGVGRGACDESIFEVGCRYVHRQKAFGFPCDHMASLFVPMDAALTHSRPFGMS